MTNRNLQAISPVTPSQLGMFIETMGAIEPGVHVEQLSWPLPGPVDVAALEAAWNAVVADCEDLRIGFVDRKTEPPLRFVVREATVHLEVVERADQDGSEEHEHEHEHVGNETVARAAAIDRFLADQRAEPLRLDQPLLFRVALLRLDDDQYQLAWTFHHILLDGWSVPLILGQVFANYQALTRDEPRPTWAPRPSREFVSWRAAQDPDEARAFWAGRIDPLTARSVPGREPSENGSAGIDTATIGPARAGQGGHEILLAPDVLSGLERQRRRHHLTLSTLVQGAWALLLAHYDDASDVVFGATVAGRPPQVPGIEDMIGLFINTVPVSVEVPAAGDVWAWLAREQARRLDERTYEHCSTGEIHAWLGTSAATPLFESVMVVENYPIPVGGDENAGPGADVPPIRTEGTTTAFPLVIVVMPEEGLRLRFLHKLRNLDETAVAIIADGFERVLGALAAGGPEVDDLAALRATMATLPVPTFRRPPASSGARRRSSDSSEPGELTPDEVALAELWQAVLDSPTPPALDTNFFEAGGHSLLSLSLIGTIRERLGVDITLGDVFEGPTFGELAAAVDRARSGARRAPIPPLLTLLRAGREDRPVFLAPPGAGTPVCYLGLASAIDSNDAVFGFRTRGLHDGEDARSEVSEIAADFVDSIRRVQPVGPYRIGGWSFGALVSWEAACQLHALGEEVEHLILMDASAGKDRGEGLLGTLAVLKPVKDLGALAAIAAQVGLPRSWEHVTLIAQLLGVGLPSSPLAIGTKHIDQARRSLGTWLANVNAAERYEPTAYAGATVLLRAVQGRPSFPDPLQHRLSPLVDGGLTVVDVPGNHMTMVLDPDNAASLGDAVTRVVTNSLTDRSPAVPRTLEERHENPHVQDLEDVRIIAFDGTQATGGTGYIGAALLNELALHLGDEKGHGLLDRTTIYAGTSAGASNALFLAMAADPLDALENIAMFWKSSEEVASRKGVTLPGMLRLVAGVGPLMDTRQLRGFYIDHFGMTRLGDLRRGVVIPAFQLDDPGALHRSWHPHVFDNLHANDPDNDELVVDVLLRSGSPPLMTAPYQALSGKGPGYIDGGVYANNPSIAALAEVAARRGDGSKANVKMLSIGNGRSPLHLAPRFKDGFGRSGYIDWVLNPRKPGLVLDLLLDANEFSSTSQSRALLVDQYHRFNPLLPGRIMKFTAKDIDHAVVQTLELQSTREKLEETIAWVDKVDWIGGTPDA